MPYKDPEKRRENKRKYYQENRERIRENAKKYYEENKEKINAYCKKYYQKNNEKIKERGKKYYHETYKEKSIENSKKYYQENIEKQKEYQQNYRQENREKAKETSKLWREKPENKERAIVQKREYRREKYYTNPCFKLRDVARASIHRALKGGKGGKSFLPYVDWTMEELKEHIENQWEEGMTWDNHAIDGWHIDHIIPQSVLLDGVDSMDHPNFRKCWSLENLQPLWAKDNLSKGNKIL